MQTYQPGTFTYNTATADFSFTGTLYRYIPAQSAEPLSARFSVVGGRWNLPNTHLLLHACSSVQTAQLRLVAEDLGDISWDTVNPEFQKDLLVLQLNVAHLADVATNGGLQSFGLPVDYPQGFAGEDKWAVTRPIGHRIFASTASGLVTRSASQTQWTGTMDSWAEVVLFPDRIDPPVLLERVPFKEWFYQ